MTTTVVDVLLNGDENYFKHLIHYGDYLEHFNLKFLFVVCRQFKNFYYFFRNALKFR